MDVTFEFCAAVAGINLLNTTGWLVVTPETFVEVLKEALEIESMLIEYCGVTVRFARASFPVPETVVRLTLE